MADSRKFYKIKEGNARGFGIETKPEDSSGPMGWVGLQDSLFPDKNIRPDCSGGARRGRSIILDFFIKFDIPKTYYDRNLIISLPLFPWRDRRISIPLPSFYSPKVDESSLYISPDELNANSISDIKTFKPS